MTLIEAHEALTLKIGGELVQLIPGEPMPLPDKAAQRLLRKMPESVRLVEADPSMNMEAMGVCIEAGPARSCCWESADGVIRRGTCVLLGMTGISSTARFWIGIETDDGRFSWVREDRLRSIQQYDAQAREPRNASCAKCGGSGPFRWICEALLCVTCRGGETHG